MRPPSITAIRNIPCSDGRILALSLDSGKGCRGFWGNLGRVQVVVGDRHVVAAARRHECVWPARSRSLNAVVF